MKYLTSPLHPNLKIHPTSGICYFKRGKLEFSLHTKDEEEGLEALKLEIAKIDSTGILAKRIRMKTAAEEYLNERYQQTLGLIEGRKVLRVGTHTEDKQILGDHLIPYFGNVKLADINEVKWKRYCKQQTVSDLTNHRKVFTCFLKWCKSEGYLRALPDVTDIPHHVRRKRRVLRPHEIVTWLTHCNGRLLLKVAIELFMGVRIGEITELEWDRIDLIHESILLRDEDVKTGQGREVPINKFVFLLLIKERQAQIEAGIKTKWVFYNENDPSRHTHKTAQNRAWKKALKASGWPAGYITTHDLRATYEKFSNTSKDHTDMQKDKMAGASQDVQKRIYVSMTADDLRGLEEVVRVPGLDQVLIGKIG